MEHVVDFPGSITTDQESALFFSTMGCCILSMTTSFLAVLTYFGIRSYDKYIVNRLSFRLIAYINVVDLAFSLFLVLSFERVAGTGSGCSFVAWGVICFGLISTFIRTMMAYHLHFVARNKAFRYSERTYWLVSIGLSLVLSLAAVIFNQLGAVEWRKLCWYRAIGLWEGMIWSWCTMYIPWAVCILYSALTMVCTIIEINKRLTEVDQLDQYGNVHSCNNRSGPQRKIYQWLQRLTGIKGNHAKSPTHSPVIQDPPNSPSNVDVGSLLSEVTALPATTSAPALTNPTGQASDRDQGLSLPNGEPLRVDGPLSPIGTQPRVNNYVSLYKLVLRVSWYPLIPFVCQIPDIASQISSFATQYHAFPLTLIAYIALGLQGTLTAMVFFTDPVITRSWRLLKRDLVTVFYFEYEWLKFCEEQLHLPKESRMYCAACPEFSIGQSVQRRSSTLERVQQWLHPSRPSSLSQAQRGNDGSDYPAAISDNDSGFPAGWREGPHLSNATMLHQSTCPTLVNDPASSFPASCHSDLNTKNDWSQESTVRPTQLLVSSPPPTSVSHNTRYPTRSHQAIYNSLQSVPSAAVSVPMTSSSVPQSYQNPHHLQLAQAQQDSMIRQSPTHQTSHRMSLSVSQPVVDRKNSLLGSRFNDGGSLHVVSYSWPLVQPREPSLPYKDDPRFRQSPGSPSPPRVPSLATSHSPTTSAHTSLFSEPTHTTASQHPGTPDINEIRLRRFKHWRRAAQTTRIRGWCETRFPGINRNQPLSAMSGTPPFRIPFQRRGLSYLLCRVMSWYTRIFLVTKHDVELLDYILCKSYSSTPPSSTSTSPDPLV